MTCASVFHHILSEARLYLLSEVFTIKKNIFIARTQKHLFILLVLWFL